MKTFIIAIALLLLGRSAAAADAVDDFRADLLAHDSATQTLTRRCASLGLASPAVIRAVRVRGEDKAADDAARDALHPAPGERVRYRRVRLTCGDDVLSEADNWYLPGALTADMNRRLDDSDTPFGAVVRPLGFHRRTLSAVKLAPPGPILRVRAVLLTPDEKAFSYVVETYAADVVGSSSGR